MENNKINCNNLIPELMALGKEKACRYVLCIIFKPDKSAWPFYRPKSIIEAFKTLKDAESYKEIVDSSVESAFIVDCASGKIIQYWN